MPVVHLPPQRTTCLARYYRYVCSSSAAATVFMFPKMHCWKAQRMTRGNRCSHSTIHSPMSCSETCPPVKNLTPQFVLKILWLFISPVTSNFKDKIWVRAIIISNNYVCATLFLLSSLNIGRQNLLREEEQRTWEDWKTDLVDHYIKVHQ